MSRQLLVFFSAIACLIFGVPLVLTAQDVYEVSQITSCLGKNSDSNVPYYLSGTVLNADSPDQRVFFGKVSSRVGEEDDTGCNFEITNDHQQPVRISAGTEDSDDYFVYTDFRVNCSDYETEKNFITGSYRDLYSKGNNTDVRVSEVRLCYRSEKLPNRWVLEPRLGKDGEIIKTQDGQVLSFLAPSHHVCFDWIELFNNGQKFPSQEHPMQMALPGGNEPAFGSMKIIDMVKGRYETLLHSDL